MALLEIAGEILLGCWQVAVEMSPYLLFGFFVAGILSVLVSPAWVERHLGGRGFLPILKSVSFGVPLPLCSCGVIAVTASIRNHGASRGAATGFLLATPQTGVDSIVATWGMMGPVFGIFRPLMALVTGLAGGAVVEVLDRRDDGGVAQDLPPKASCSAECCEGNPRRNRVVQALVYGFHTLPGDIARPLILGILVAAAITALVPADSLAGYVGGGILPMLVMIAVGVPMYVCSTASIPIALGFMHLGVSPGAAFAFLIAGPATNAATIATVWKMLGRRTALIYLGTVVVGALTGGLLLDSLYAWTGQMPPHGLHHGHEGTMGWLGVPSAFALVIMLLLSQVRHMPGAAPQKEPDTTMQTLTLAVSGMTCSHCAGAVQRGLAEQPGVTEVSVDLAGGRAVVFGKVLNEDGLCTVVRRLGYEAHIERTHA